MKFLKKNAQKALMATVTMSLVMGVCGSAMAGSTDSYFGQSDLKSFVKASKPSPEVATGFNGEWTATCGDGDGVANEIFGGFTNSAEASKNIVTVSGGTVRYVYGGFTQVGNAKDNTVNIRGGNSFYKVTGGDGYVVATNNTVNIIQGTFADVAEVIGGNGYSGNATNNTVCIGGYIENGQVFTAKGTIDAPGLTVYGGKAASGKESSGNTVKVMSVGNEIRSLNMKTIQNLEFYIPKTAINGNTMLKVKGDVILGNPIEVLNLSNVESIKAGVEPGSKLAVGDKVTLIESREGIEGFDKAKTGVVDESDFKQFGLEIKQDDNKINAEITSIPTTNPTNDGGRLKEEAKSPVETQAAGLTMLTTGADMLAGQGFDNAAAAIAEDVAAGGSVNVMTPFVTMGGAKTKVKSGSHVDVKGWNLNVGFAKEIENKAGKLLIGPVVEYGKGSYDSYLDNGYHGEGDTDYIGGGVMAKQTNDNGFYYEGSLRAGKLSNDYKANANSYDSDSTYYAAHLGIGKILKLSEKNSLDYYGKYFYTHQKGDSTTLHVGGVDYDLRFDSVESNRTRIGGRFTHDVNEKNSVYAGLAWQHEFSGTARATIDGAGTPAPSVKGNTGIMELGWKVNANKNLDLDLGATGYTGKQKGASLNLALNFKF